VAYSPPGEFDMLGLADGAALILFVARFRWLWVSFAGSSSAAPGFRGIIRQ